MKHTPRDPAPRRRHIAAIVVIAILAAHAAARAQTLCGQNSGPDLIVGNIHSVSNYNPVADIDAFAVAGDNCNIGTLAVQYQSGSNHHPITGQNLYRYKVINGAGRLEQIGMSWVIHYFTVLSEPFCCPTCTGPGGSQLGVGCSDINTSVRHGTQLSTTGGLGPRFDINAHTGAYTFPYPFRNTNGSVPVTSITRRLQAHTADLDPAQNPDARYFAESLTVAPDECANRNQNNNASHREITFTQIGANYVATLPPLSSTMRESPAIHAWQLLDPAVLETQIDTPEIEFPTGSGNNSGRLILAARATHLVGPTWHYEYALLNINSDRAVSAFSVPIPESIAVSNPGFHDVDYHSGDGFNSTPDNQINFDGADWPASIAPTAVTWSIQPATPVENSNALRWGTTYNFRFDANSPPSPGPATLTLFKPVLGLPDAITANTIVPGLPCLPGDLNNDGQVTTADIPFFIDYLLAESTDNPCPADLDLSSRPDGPDIPPFVNALLGR